MPQLKALKKTQNILTLTDFRASKRRATETNVFNDKRSKSDMIIYIQELQEVMSEEVLRYEKEIEALKQRVIHLSIPQ